MYVFIHEEFHITLTRAAAVAQAEAAASARLAAAPTPTSFLFTGRASRAAAAEAEGFATTREDLFVCILCWRTGPRLTQEFFSRRGAGYMR